MTETIAITAEPARSPDPAKWTPGEYLRKLREEKGHTHAAVGTALHLTVHYIKALESDDYGKLPGLTFVKGYLRAYARFLGGDVDKVLALFDEHIVGLLDAGKHTARVERSKRRQDQALRWGVGAGFVVVAGLVAGWWFMSGGTEPVQTAAVTPAAQPVAVAPPPANPAAANRRISTAAATTVTTVMPPSSAVVSAANVPGQTALADAQQGTPIAPNTTATAGNELPTATASVTPSVSGGRQVSLVGTGDDELRVSFNGSSWIEVDDGSRVRIYQDMLAAGDTLTIRGDAPFHVLLGNAANVDLMLNAAAVDISADIRADLTARVVLGAPAEAPQGAQQPTQGAPL